MCLIVLSLTLLARCYEAILINEKGIQIPFICASSPDKTTLNLEADIAPDMSIGLRSFLLNKNKLWPGGTVPYDLDPDFTPEQKSMILDSMDQFNRHSCLRWAPRQDQRDYVKIVHSPSMGTCSSAVGRKGGKQTLKLGDNCFLVDEGYQGAILHEMMHTIGFIHEQQRIDRDCFVTVSQQMSINRKHDYGITEDTDTQFPYDFASLMHYGTSEELSSRRGENLGNDRGGFTALDKMKLNHMYCGGETYCQGREEECQRFHEAQSKCLY